MIRKLFVAFVPCAMTFIAVAIAGYFIPLNKINWFWAFLACEGTFWLLLYALISRGIKWFNHMQWMRDDLGQDIAEYAVMLAVILVIVIGTVRLIGGNANNVFSKVGAGLDSSQPAPTQ